jgi:hypothetical protein
VKALQTQRLAILIGTALLALLGQGGVCRAESEAEIQKRIASMPAPQRERLARNFEAFKRMSPAERDKYRKLHQELTADPKSAQLRNLMQEYFEWMKTLDIRQRTDLREEKNPELRQEMVAHFRIEQKHKQELGLIPTNQDGSGKGPGRGLSKEDLGNVMRIFENKIYASNAIPKVAWDRIGTLSGVDRYRVFLETVCEPGEKGEPAPARKLSPETFTEMANGISDEQQRHQVLSKPAGFSQARELFLLIARGMIQQLRQEIGQNAAGDETLRRFFVDLDSKRKDEVMKAPQDQRVTLLVNFYMQKIMRLSQSATGADRSIKRVPRSGQRRQNAAAHKD